MMIFFFFFQAEDGIRDTSVTGVQTCALPIWEHHQLGAALAAAADDALDPLQAELQIAPERRRDRGHGGHRTGASAREHAWIFRSLRGPPYVRRAKKRGSVFDTWSRGPRWPLRSSGRIGSRRGEDRRRAQCRDR